MAGEVASATGQTSAADAVSHAVRQRSGAGSRAGEITGVQGAYLPDIAAMLCPRHNRLHPGYTAVSPAMVSQRLRQRGKSLPVAWYRGQLVAFRYVGVSGRTLTTECSHRADGGAFSLLLPVCRGYQDLRADSQ